MMNKSQRIATLERDLDDLLKHLRLQRNPYRPVASADFVRVDDAQAEAQPLTAEDAKWLVRGDEYTMNGATYAIGVGIAATLHEIQHNSDFCNEHRMLTPATAAAIARRKAQAAPEPLTKGDAVEVIGPTTTGRTDEIGKTGVIELVGTDNVYQVRYADGEFCGAFEGSSLRKLPAEQPDMQPAAPAEQPAPAADLRREIEAALDKLTNSDDGLTYGEQSIRFEAAIRAAAAVPYTIEIGVRGYTPTDYYNAGQDSILAPILAALTQGGK